MKINWSLIIALLISLFPSRAMAANDVIEKTFCAQAINYESLDKLKTDLLTNAKRLAVNQIFGELIAASTAVENFVVTSDQIRTSSVGFIRIEGSIDYYNGANLAEVCVSIQAYTTAQDKKKFEPIKLSKRHCVTNPSLTTRELTDFAKEEGIVQALLDYDRKVEVIDRDKLLRLMQRVDYSESGFISETETYCTRVNGYVTPIEIIALLEANSVTGGSATSSSNIPDGSGANPSTSSNLASAAPTTTASDGIVYFGQSKDVNGLLVSVSPPYYESGCGGKLDFEVTLSNQTKAPIVMSFGLGEIKLSGNGERPLGLFGELGAATPRCYGGFNIGTLAPNTTIKFAIRTVDNISDFSYLDLSFGEKAGRLSSEKWRLDLSTTYDIKRTFFGEIVNIDGLEVTVGDENYFPGCGGALGFQITLRNTTKQPITLGMGSGNLRLYADNGSGLDVHSKLGEQSTDCYSGFNIETIKPETTMIVAVRTTTGFSGLSYIDFIFESNNRLAGLRWRLNIPR